MGQRVAACVVAPVVCPRRCVVSCACCVGVLTVRVRALVCVRQIDSPEVFGLHPNADLTYRVKEVTSLLRTFSETQPRQTGGGSGRSVEVGASSFIVHVLLTSMRIFISLSTSLSAHAA